MRVERECKEVGLLLNSSKTKAIYANTEVETLKNEDLEEIKQALTESGEQDFKYLGSWCNKGRDIATRKALAWRSLNKMYKIWKSQIDEKLKLMLFKATTEAILLYGSQTWTLTVEEEKSLDGAYTRMLTKVKNVSWQDKIANKTLYGKLKPVTQIIHEHRMGLAGHVYRDKTSPTHKTILWQPKHGTMGPGRPKATFVDTLLRDTKLLSTTDLESCMKDRDVWSQMCGSRDSSLDRK